MQGYFIEMWLIGLIMVLEYAIAHSDPAFITSTSESLIDYGMAVLSKSRR